MNGASDFALIAPELTLTIGGLIVLMIAAFAKGRTVGLATGVGLATLLLALVIQFVHAGASGTPFAGTLSIDAFAAFAKVLIYGATAACLWMAPRFFDRAGAGGGMRPEYVALMLFAAVGMSLMVSARDLLTLYVGLELNSLAAYVLASFIRTDERSSEAGLKYFVLGALASGILLYGMSLLYGFAGTTDFAGLAAASQKPLGMGFLFGLVFVLAGLAFKVSAVPFHMWTPDVYEGAPTPVTAFFATAPKVAAVALLARVTVEALGGALAAWQQIMIFLSLASIIVGAIGAIGQKNIKRLLAYSSINNVGFMLIGIAAGTPDGIAAVLTYLLVYVVTTVGMFLIVLQLRDGEGRLVESIPALAGFSVKRPWLAGAFAAFLFSLAGIPPLFGFWPKYLVFDAAVKAGLLTLAIAGIVASVIGAYYYIAIVKTMYFDDASDTAFPERTAPVDGALIAASAVLVSAVGYLFLSPLATLSGAAARALF